MLTRYFYFIVLEFLCVMSIFLGSLVNVTRRESIGCQLSDLK